MLEYNAPSNDFIKKATTLDCIKDYLKDDHW